jgi:hypothetical protein
MPRRGVGQTPAVISPPGSICRRRWVDSDYLGSDEGLTIIMIENFRSGLVWRYMRRSAYLGRGLERDGLRSGAHSQCHRSQLCRRHIMVLP